MRVSRYFGTDGIRGRVGQGLISADFVLRLGNALGRVLAQGHGDTRPTMAFVGTDARYLRLSVSSLLLRRVWWPLGADVQLDSARCQHLRLLS